MTDPDLDRNPMVIEAINSPKRRFCVYRHLDR